MISRRCLLACAVSSVSVPPLLRAAGRGTTLTPALSRYDDLATDLPITRLTDPAVSSILPAAGLARRGSYLLYASDASGRFEAYRMDLKKGDARQVSDAPGLRARSLTLLPGDNAFCYFDGDILMNAGFSAARQIYKPGDGYQPTDAIHVTSDGLYAAFVEKRAMSHKLRLINLRTSVAATLAEADEEISAPATRPKRASVLYLRAGGIYLANFDGKQNYRLRLSESHVLQATWSPDGRAVFYLTATGGLREFLPDANEDRPIADTSQYAAFARNGDGSVFVGAGGSKVSPYIMLLVRAVKRELTLCEHRATDPTLVTPRFSPNSQQIFFNSDLHGKPAIYRMDVEKLVEATAE